MSQEVQDGRACSFCDRRESEFSLQELGETLHWVTSLSLRLVSCCPACKARIGKLSDVAIEGLLQEVN